MSSSTDGGDHGRHHPRARARRLAIARTGRADAADLAAALASVEQAARRKPVAVVAGRRRARRGRHLGRPGLARRRVSDTAARRPGGGEPGGGPRHPAGPPAGDRVVGHPGLRPGRRRGRQVVARSPQLSAPLGATIERGGVIAGVDGAPVVALFGDTPLWRTMAVGDEGHDVFQLEAEPGCSRLRPRRHRRHRRHLHRQRPS